MAAKKLIAAESLLQLCTVCITTGGRFKTEENHSERFPQEQPRILRLESQCRLSPKTSECVGLIAGANFGQKTSSCNWPTTKSKRR